MGAALDELGPGTLGGAVAILCGAARLTEHISDQEAVHPVALGSRDRVLAEFTARAAPPELVHHLRTLGESDVGADVKRAALRMLADAPAPEALEAMFDVARTLDPASLASPSTRAVVADGIAIRLRARADLDALERVAEGAPAELVPAIASGVRRSGLAESLSFLAKLLYQSAEGDLCVLREIERCARECGAEADSWSLASVRGMLVREESDLRRTAAAALGSLHDVDSAPDLIELLGDGDVRVAQTARSALLGMAGFDHGPEQEPWRVWLTEEEEWWSDQATLCVERLAGGDPAEAHKALRTALVHPLWRHELAEAIGPLLRRMERPVGIAACTVLERLGSPRAVPHLVELLVLEDPELTAAACAALRLLTGLELPPDPIAWSERLDRRP